MAKTRSKHQGDLYKQYANELRWSKNRKRKLNRALKAQPNNLQIVEALKNIKYRRKTPGTSVLTNQKKHLVQLLSDARKGSNPFPDKLNPKKMFSLAERAHTKQGEQPWRNS